jgi:hypothetical protein
MNCYPATAVPMKRNRVRVETSTFHARPAYVSDGWLRSAFSSAMLFNATSPTFGGFAGSKIACGNKTSASARAFAFPFNFFASRHTAANNYKLTERLISKIVCARHVCLCSNINLHRG